LSNLFFLYIYGDGYRRVEDQIKVAPLWY